MKQYKISILLVSLFMAFSLVQAQDMTGSQEFIIRFGAFGPGNIAVYQFAPTDVKIHRGDTVTWLLDAETNIHFEETFVPVFTGAEIAGQSMPVYNPAVAFPTIENGASYTGGDVNSGALGLVSMDQGLKAFSLVMDVEPGSYTFFSDIHVRSGTITVVPDDESIPNPGEVAVTAAVQLETAIEEGIEAFSEMQLEMAMQSDTTENIVTVGLRVADNGVYVRQFFPPVTIIQVGESVTWEVPDGNNDGHTVTYPPIGVGELLVLNDPESESPMYTFGPTLQTFTQDGDTIHYGEPIHFLIGNAQSVTLTFAEEGVYPYVDNLHAPGMDGVIVVLPAQ